MLDNKDIIAAFIGENTSKVYERKSDFVIEQIRMENLCEVK